MHYLKQRIARVEQKANISVNEYLQFGQKGTAQFKFSSNGWSGWKYIGEWSAYTDKPNGRGIIIYSDGGIWMQ